MASLDLRKFNLGTHNIMTFETKKAAKAFKMPHLCYPMEAANRFWLFYVIARTGQDGKFHIMTKDGGFLEVPKVMWAGDRTYATV